MSSIQTGIELNDQFSGVLNNIISSVNLAISAMADMQQSMNADIDTSSLQGVRDEINQATAALNELNDAMQNDRSVQATVQQSAPQVEQTAPDIAPPVVDGSNQEFIPVQIDPVLPDPLIENPDPVPLEVQPNAPPEVDPVEVPVTWQTDNLDVFTGTGVERFQQEVQSANDMLNTLNTTQAHIAQTAQGMDILPDAAVQDMNTMQQRLATIQQRLATIQQIENNKVNIGTDQANAELEQLRGQLDSAIQAQNELNDAMQNMDVSAANDAYLCLSQTVSRTERYIRDNVDEQGRFNQEIASGTQQANELTNTIKRAVAAYISIQSVRKALDISDELTQTTSRLDMMNDGLQSTSELVNMVYAAAQDARGSFSQMADVVARFGNNAKDAFGSSEEVVAFADLIQKQMTIAGASTQEAANAELQLSQALGSGVLRGDELNSIFEQAPNLIQNIADYLDVPIGKIREMAADGELSADVVKASIFAAADDINSKFESMPMTWGQIRQSMQNTALIAFQPVLQRLNDLANSEAFQTFVQNAVEAMAILASILLNVFDLAVSIGTFIGDNWSIIAPIVYGIVAALTAYIAISTIVTAINGIMAMTEGVKAAAQMMATGATFAETAAQQGLNAALLACPLTWIIMLILALIVVIFAVCNAIAKMTGVTQSGFGLICGVISIGVAFIRNLVIGLINMVIVSAVNLYNMLANFAASFSILFDDPAAAIKATMLSLFNFIVGVVSKAAAMLDAVFGSNLAGAVSQFQGKIQSEIDATIESVGGSTAQTLNPADYMIDRIDYGNAFNAGAVFGDGIAEKISDFSLSDVLGKVDLPNVSDYISGFNDAIANSGIGNGINDINDNTGKIKDSLEVSEEELKYLRDIAEQEAINRFTTAEINVDMSGMQNTVNGGDDIDGFMTKLTDSVNEAVDNMTEGVHE